jgi:transposase
VWNGVGHLVSTGSMFAFLAQHRQDVFPDGEFEDLFPSGKGRPSIPASVMASILVLQTLHDLSDRETAEAARCDLRWKVATGMALDHSGFDPSTLVYWRKRLAKSTRPQRINEAVRRVIEEIGIVRGRRKRAVDRRPGRPRSSAATHRFSRPGPHGDHPKNRPNSAPS